MACDNYRERHCTGHGKIDSTLLNNKHLSKTNDCQDRSEGEHAQLGSGSNASGSKNGTQDVQPYCRNQDSHQSLREGSSRSGQRTASYCLDHCASFDVSSSIYTLCSVTLYFISLFHTIELGNNSETKKWLSPEQMLQSLCFIRYLEDVSRKMGLQNSHSGTFQKNFPK